MFGWMNLKTANWRREIPAKQAKWYQFKYNFGIKSLLRVLVLTPRPAVPLLTWSIDVNYEQFIDLCIYDRFCANRIRGLYGVRYYWRWSNADEWILWKRAQFYFFRHTLFLLLSSGFFLTIDLSQLGEKYSLLCTIFLTENLHRIVLTSNAFVPHSQCSRVVPAGSDTWLNYDSILLINIYVRPSGEFWNVTYSTSE